MQEKLQDKGSARRAASKPPNDAPKTPANSFSSAKTVLRAMRIARALQVRRRRRMRCEPQRDVAVRRFDAPFDFP